MSILYVKVSGNDDNGGDSLEVEQSGTDGVTTSSSTFSSPSASFDASHVGRRITISGFTSIITELVSSTSVKTSINYGNASNSSWTIGGPWASFNKLLGTNGMVSGDVAYVGGGVYRNSVTVSMTSAVIETKIIGDVSGRFTGDAGEVVLTSHESDQTTSTSGLVLSGRDYLTFENITFISTSSSSGTIRADAATSSHITLRNCTITATGNGTRAVTALAGANTPLNWLIERCIIVNVLGIGVSLLWQFTSTQDWDVDFVMKDCFIWSGGIAILTGSSGGSGSFKGGGMKVFNSTVLGGSTAAVSVSDCSTTYPCTIENSLVVGTSGAAFTTPLNGRIIENNNRVHGSPVRSNVTAGVLSRNLASFNYEVGQSFLYGLTPKPFFSPKQGFPTTFDGHLSASSSNLDLLERPRGGNGVVEGDRGNCSSATASTLTDSSKHWGTNQFKDYYVRMLSGASIGEQKRVCTNTKNTLSLSGSTVYSGDWATIPSADDEYVIFRGPQAETGKATGGSSTSLTNTTASWTTNQWSGYTLEIVNGTGSGQAIPIESNTSTVITATFSVAPDSTSEYKIYFVDDINVPRKAIGAYDVHDVARKETGTTVSGVGITIVGKGDHDFLFAVNDMPTLISIKARYDSLHGTASKPRMILLASDELTLDEDVATMTEGADSWETLTVGPFTPSKQGVITIRLESRSEDVLGRAYFDSFSVE